MTIVFQHDTNSEVGKSTAYKARQTCSRILTRSNGAVSVLPMAPATAPAKNSTPSRGSSASAASGRRSATCTRGPGCTIAKKVLASYL